MAMPWIATGVICLSIIYYHLLKIGDHYIIAQSFMVYSILSVVTLFISGFLIDRYSAVEDYLYLYEHTNLLFSCFCPYFHFTSPISSFVFFGLIGII